MGSIREQWTYRNSGKKTNISRFFFGKDILSIPKSSNFFTKSFDSSDLAQEGSTWSLPSHQFEKPWGPQRSHLAYPLSYHKRKCVKINVCKWKYMPSTVCRELLAKQTVLIVPKRPCAASPCSLDRTTKRTQPTKWDDQPKRTTEIAYQPITFKIQLTNHRITIPSLECWNTFLETLA